MLRNDNMKCCQKLTFVLIMRSREPNNNQAQSLVLQYVMIIIVDCLQVGTILAK